MGSRTRHRLLQHGVDNHYHNDNDSRPTQGSWQFSYFPGLYTGCLCASDHNFHVIFHVLSRALLFLLTEYRMCEFASRLYNNLVKHLSPVSKKVLSAPQARKFLTAHRQVNSFNPPQKQSLCYTNVPLKCPFRSLCFLLVRTVLRLLCRSEGVFVNRPLSAN